MCSIASQYQDYTTDNKERLINIRRELHRIELSTAATWSKWIAPANGEQGTARELEKVAINQPFHL